MTDQIIFPVPTGAIGQGNVSGSESLNIILAQNEKKKVIYNYLLHAHTEENTEMNNSKECSELGFRDQYFGVTD